MAVTCHKEQLEQCSIMIINTDLILYNVYSLEYPSFLMYSLTAWHTPHITTKWYWITAVVSPRCMPCECWKPKQYCVFDCLHSCLTSLQCWLSDQFTKPSGILAKIVESSNAVDLATSAWPPSAPSCSLHMAPKSKRSWRGYLLFSCTDRLCSACSQGPVWYKKCQASVDWWPWLCCYASQVSPLIYSKHIRRWSSKGYGLTLVTPVTILHIADLMHTHVTSELVLHFERKQPYSWWDIFGCKTCGIASRRKTALFDMQTHIIWMIHLHCLGNGFDEYRV